MINKLNENKNRIKILRIIVTTILVATICISATQIGKFKRDKDLLTDVYAIGKIIPHSEIIYIPEDMWNDWSLRVYLIRNYYISTKKYDGNNLKYFLIRKNLLASLVPKNYHRVSINTNEIDLYELTN
jgi:hypothetical protein